MANKLTLNPIVDISVSLAARAAARRGFNVALILGTSSVIPENERVRTYTSVDALLADGFTTDSAEYKAALLYFSATIKPTKLAVGVKTSNDKSLLAAAQACRAANSEWYILVPLGAAYDDLMAIAAWVETATPDTILFYTTSDSSVSPASDTSGKDAIFYAMKQKAYQRTFGQYCGQIDTPDAVAATAGYAMGANRSTSNSAFTLAYKTLPGVTTDSLTENQVEQIAGGRTSTGANGNVYVTRDEDYNLLQYGRMANGTAFDEILNLDMLKNDIKLNVMDLLANNRKIPQTNAGVASIVNVINTACNKYVGTGFIAPGKWNGGTVLNLEDGTYLTNGYLVQAEDVDDQSQADRDARKAPPIYVSVKLAGAIEFVTIEVYVNR